MAKLRLFLLVGLVAIASALAFHLFAGAGRETQAVAAADPLKPAPRVISVRTGLPAGHILRPDDLAEVRWANGRPPAGAIAADSTEARALSGAVTRRAFSQGELIMPGSVIRPGERGFLAALVSPGYRAIAVSVEAATAAGGLIWPGDRVDLILTQEIREDGVPLSQQVVSETILSDVRILSTDQRMERAGDTAGTVEEKVEPHRVPTTVTVEVTPEQAERVTVAGTLGQLHLTLRGVATGEALPPASGDQPVTWAGTVSPALGNVRTKSTASLSAAPAAQTPTAAPAPRQSGVRVYRGSEGA